MQTVVFFPKSEKEDTQYIIWYPLQSAYLSVDIGSYEGGRHFERNCFKMQKWKTSKVYQPSTILGRPLNFK